MALVQGALTAAELPPRPAAGVPARVAKPNARAPLLPQITVLPIIEAAKTNGAAEIKAMLAEKPDAWQEKDERNWTPLHHAADVNACAAAAVLLQAGADVNARAMMDATPLHLATWRGWMEVSELLLDRKAEVNARDHLKATPLMNAAGSGVKPLVELLLKHGADINALNKNSVSALLVATSTGEPHGIAELLVQSGAAVNVQDRRDGCTPLHDAVTRSNRVLLELLIEKKADLNAQTLDGETALSLAMFEANHGFAERLRQCGARMPAENPMTVIEKSLVDQYRQMHQVLAGGTFQEVRQMQTNAWPTRPEIEKIFLRGAGAAYEFSEKIRRNELFAMGMANKSDEDRQNFLNLLRQGARPGEYIRLEPLPASSTVLAAKDQQYIAPEIPVHCLLVKRRGTEPIVLGDFFLVGQRWVMIPFTARIFPDLK